MELIGFVGCFVALIWASCSALFALWFCLPRYNPVGGALNTKASKIAVILFAAAVIWGWALLFDNAPFTLTVNP